MRIVLDLQACQASSMNRGIGRYSIALAQAIVRRGAGHDLRIALNGGFPDSVATIRNAFDGLLAQSQISTYDLPVPVAESDPANAWRVRAAERIREHYLAGLRPDIVHVASLFEGWADNSVTSVLHGGGQFDTGITLYDLIPLMRKERYLSDPNVTKWYYRKLQSLKNAELLLAISAHSRREAMAALQLPGDTVVNISSAVDDIFKPHTLAPAALAELKARYGLKRDFIMYTGGIDYRKNIEGLIEAYGMLPGAVRQQYQLAVVCAVTAPDRTRLQKLAAGFRLAEDDLVLTGFVSDDDLVALYNSTALFVFPSLQEGFGLPALEAMACGAPVIGSNNSSIPEVIGRADALFDPTSPAQISSSMANVLADRAFQTSLREHGLVQATRFSWNASADCALEAFDQVHQQRRASRQVAVSVGSALHGRRPRLAYVSPMPPERSGIAGYSAELLPELAKYYDIELILAQETLSDAWASSNFPCRSVAWFDQHADAFDRIVYQFGNSTFHQHMFGLLERHPGIVVLHDFFLSGIASYAEAASPHRNNYARMLYLAHGYHALHHERADGRIASLYHYPCNKHVLDRATGVIAHSAYALDLARAWYGPAAADDWRLVALPRVLPNELDHTGTRARLGLSNDDYLVCSFGMIALTKCNDRIVEAWLASALGQDPRCHLVFVGENNAEGFGNALSKRIAMHPRIRITGYASDAQYRAYLTAADAAVQLRTHSRGETSATVLDCMAYGLPTIINRHGSAAELPADACVQLDDEFTDEALGTALEALRTQPELRTRLAEKANSYMRLEHHPARVGVTYRDAIEDILRESSNSAYRRLLGSLASISGDEVTQSDLRQAAASIALNRQTNGVRQLLVDVTVPNGAADVQVATLQQNLIRALLSRPTPGYRVEPIMMAEGEYRYARQFTLHLLGLDDIILQDTVVEVHAGDVALSLVPNGSAQLPLAWTVRDVQSAAVTQQELDCAGHGALLARLSSLFLREGSSSGAAADADAP